MKLNRATDPIQDQQPPTIANRIDLNHTVEPDNVTNRPGDFWRPSDCRIRDDHGTSGFRIFQHLDQLPSVNSNNFRKNRTLYLSLPEKIDKAFAATLVVQKHDVVEW